MITAERRVAQPVVMKFGQGVRTHGDAQKPVSIEAVTVPDTPRGPSLPED
jgi:hypothetical protein